MTFHSLFVYQSYLTHSLILKSYLGAECSGTLDHRGRELSDVFLNDEQHVDVDCGAPVFPDLSSVSVVPAVPQVIHQPRCPAAHTTGLYIFVTVTLLTQAIEG